uniref:1-acyl-sn-glycerol-3-phosphate acyltransferase n=1 Tax=Saccoglossus kowalevskii TaxID=10224 RepID=A0ABM0H1C9_SACKO|nr:PREDICTED: 1-acyl-sn-glycerol-3-phosphate acyltransferase alpha-like [Saccoglossus kowalevskii]
MAMYMNCLQWIAGLIAGGVFLLYILCQFNRVVHYHVKNVSSNLWYALLGVFVIPFTVWNPFDPANTRWFTFWIRTLCTKEIFDVKTNVKNLHYLDADEPRLLVGNHQSTMDQIGAMEIWPQRCAMVAKKSLLYAGTFGIAAWLCGTIFVDRRNATNAKETTDNIVNIIKKKKTSVWMYPEGTRSTSTDLDMLPFKKGAFYVAIQAQIPIVPVVFSNYKDSYNPKEYLFQPVEFTMTILPPISTKGRKLSDVQELSDEVREVMLKTYRETSPKKATKKD